MKTLSKITLLVIFIVFMAVGCSSQNTKSEMNENIEQHLIIGEQFDLRGYDPGSSMSDFIRVLVYNNLVELDMNFEKSPGLAIEWWSNDDATVWTFKLREDIFFHDGEPWDAEAAKINLDYRREGTGKGWLNSVEEIKVLDTYLLEIVLNQSVYTFDSELTPPFLAMVSPNAIGEDGEITAAIGTGPFKLTDWKQDQSFEMVRNEEYFEGAPFLERLTFKVIPDAQTRALALENGEIHMMSGREGLTAVQRLKDKSHINVVKSISQTSEVMFMNTTEGLLVDKSLREAINYGIDLDIMVSELLEDLAEAPKNFFSEAYIQYIDENKTLIKKDTEKAIQILEEHGWDYINPQGIREKDGIPLQLRMVLGAGNEEDKLLSLAIQDELKEIGIELELIHLEGGALRDALSAKNYDIIMIGQWLIPHDEPTSHYLKGYWHSESAYSIYHTPELDSKIEKLHNSLDEQERIDLHKEIQKDILDAHGVSVVFHRNNVMLVHEDVQGFDISVGTWQIFRGLINSYMK